MKNLFKGKIDGCEKTPRYDDGIFFSVHTNTIPVVLEDCSRKKPSQEEQIELTVQTPKENSIVINSLSHYEYEDRLIHRQDEIIKALEKQIADEEQELFEKDRQIEQLEKDLEEVCEELFLEANLR
jgi:hypothetical protein